MYISRKIEEKINQSLQQFPVVLLTGPRQSGKSTLLENKFKEYKYVSLDNPLKRNLANEDPELFLSQHKAPLVIDEIQYAPQLLSYIKIIVDQDRDNYGQFILTGSQIFEVMSGVTESLAGRIAIFHLYPLTWDEITHDKNMSIDVMNDDTVAQHIIRGFYPELYKNKKINLENWFGSYLTTYIERDVRSIKAISDLTRFQTFIEILATRAGQLLNISDIANAVGIKQPTAKSWLSLLESTYIIKLLRPFYNNHSKRLVKSPKLYFVDTGLLCYLLGIDNSVRFFKASERGAVFENMIVMEFIKKSAFLPFRIEPYFYRTAKKDEIDIILSRQGKKDAFEVKLSKTLTTQMSSTLESLFQQGEIDNANLISLQTEQMMLSKNVKALHWSKIINWQ